MAKNTYLPAIESKKQTRKMDRIMEMESVLMVARWEGKWGNGRTGEGIKKYK